MSLLKRLLQILGSKADNGPDYIREATPETPVVLEFDALPDGKYLARFLSEQISEGNYVKLPKESLRASVFLRFLTRRLRR